MYNKNTLNLKKTQIKQKMFISYVNLANKNVFYVMVDV